MKFFERFISLIANLITIFQLIFSLLASSPRIEVSIGQVASEMILPSRIVIYILLGCISAFSYASSISLIINKINESFALFFSLMLSTLGAWFAFLLVKVLFNSEIEKVPINVSYASVDFLTIDTLLICSFGLLFVFGLSIFGVVINPENEGNKDSVLSSFVWTTMGPFFVFSIF